MRTVIEQTGEGSVTRERTGQGKPARHKLPGNAKPVLIGINLQFKSRQPGPVHSVGELAEIAVSEDRRIQDIDYLVVETFQNRPSKVGVWIDNERGRAKIRSTIGGGRGSGRRRVSRDQAGKIMLDNELPSENRGNRAHIDMPPVGADRQALEPFRAVNKSVGPFVSDFRSQGRIADLAFLDLILGEVGEWIGN